MAPFLPLSLRLTLWSTGIFLVTFLVFGGAMWLDLAASLREGRDKTITNRARRLAGILEQAPPTRLPARYESFVDGTPEGRLIQVFNSKRERVLPPPGIPAEAFPWPPDLFSQRHAFTETTYQGRHYRIFVRPVETRDGSSLLVLAAGQLEDNRQLLERFSAGLIWTTPLLLLVSGVCGYLFSRRALEPVDRLTASVQSISIGNLSRRLPVSQTNDELQRLAETYNGMLARLEVAVSQIRSFTADASHELRSPLSVIRTVAECALLHPGIDPDSAEAFQDIVAESSEACRLLEDMLTLARADAGHAETAFERLDLREVLAEVCAKSQPMAEARRHQLFLNLPVDAPGYVTGDASSLRRLFWILLDNAIKYTPPGGTIRVTLHPSPDRLDVRVEDSGVGIPAAALPHIFDRFYRVDASRSHEEGTGLGLAIAQWIASTHRALLTAASTEDQGTTFRVEFPRLE